MPDHRSMIQSLYDAFGRGDAETVLGALHPEAEWNEAESSPYAEGNPHVGPQQVAEGVFGPLLEDFPDFVVSPEKLVGQGDTVVVLGRYTGTHSETGRTLDAQFAHVWTVADGAVVRFQQYTDTAQYRRVMDA